jgi:hypothetical protein
MFYAFCTRDAKIERLYIVYSFGRDAKIERLYIVYSFGRDAKIGRLYIEVNCICHKSKKQVGIIGLMP